MFVIGANGAWREDRPMSTDLQSYVDHDAINTCAEGLPPLARSRRIGFLIYEGVDLVDLCGPFDVFTYTHSWLQMTGRTGERGYETLIIGPTRGPIAACGGLQIVASHCCDETLEELDTLIVVGTPWPERACGNSSVVAWIARMAPRVRRVVSVCTGAFLLAEAGLLRDRRATTHWMYCDQLAARHPDVRIEPDRIFVRDGHIYTSGGITAGIDLALALVEEDLGREAPRFVAGLMVMFLRRPGGQKQFSVFLQAEPAGRADFRELQGWILANPVADLSVEALAERVAMSPRNFARQFRAETAMTPAKFVEHARLEAARCKLEQTNLLLDAVAKATGFGSTERMHRAFQRSLAVTPQDYRERFQSTARQEPGREP
jgi:transcriptional regulator GlxA family with amidase domain